LRRLWTTTGWPARTDRRGWAPLVAVALGCAALAAGAAAAGEERDTPAPDQAELPRGGTSVLPQNRVIGFYGAPQARSLGELGIGSPASAAKRLKRQIRPYEPRSRQPILPVFELLGTIALASPGEDGKYRARQPDRIIRRYSQTAKRNRFLLMMDIQPGRSTFIEEARHLRRWLRKPYVSIALDPEWNMGPNGTPGEEVGSVSAKMVNRVTRFLTEIVRRHHLPQKLVVVHQFTDDMIRHKGDLKARPGVDLVLNADGFGTRQAKTSKYEQLAPPRGSKLFPGFKLFYEEDDGLMSPKQVMRLDPRPFFVVYE
jgi:hypothetical protein